MDEKLLMESLDSISKGVNGMNDKIKGIDERLSAVETLTKAKPADNEAVKALEEKFNKEIAGMKSMSFITPEMTEKNFLVKKAGMYKKLFKALINKDFAALEEFKKTDHTFNETAGTGDGQIGYFVPEEYANTIVDFNVKYQGKNSILPFITNVPMNKHVMNLSEYVDGIAAGMIGPHTSITQSTSSADNYKLTAEKIAALVPYDNEVLQDVTPAVLTMIEQHARNAFDKRQNYCLLSGTGAEDYENVGITGVLNASDVNVVTMAASGYNTLTAQNLADMVSAITVDIDEGVFVFPKTLRSVIMGLKDEQGLIWKPSNTNYGPETIWGYPVIWINGILPATSAIGANTKFGIFGDFRKGSYWGDRLTLEVAVDTSLLFDKYQTVVRWVKRGDAKVFGKCFAVLKTHA